MLERIKDGFPNGDDENELAEHRKVLDGVCEENWDVNDIDTYTGFEAEKGVLF